MTSDILDIPYDDIVSFGQRNMIHSDMFNVTWHLGRFCNYDCSYCWPNAHSKTKDHRPTELCLLTINEIKRQARNNGFNSFNFSLTGGEPTFHPGFFDIVKELNDDAEKTNLTKLIVISNCSRNMNWFEKFTEYTKSIHYILLNASFHIETLKDKNDWQEFADKLSMIRSYKVDILINIVMTYENFYKNLESAHFFRDNKFNVNIKPQQKDGKINENYTDEMLDILKTGFSNTYRMKETILSPKIQRPKVKINTFKDLTEEERKNIKSIELKDSKGNIYYIDKADRLSSLGFNKFKGWTCFTGYQSIFITEPSGNIVRGINCWDKPIGNIETGFELFDKPKKCITNLCLCGGGIKTPKIKE